LAQQRKRCAAVVARDFSVYFASGQSPEALSVMRVRSSISCAAGLSANRLRRIVCGGPRRQTSDCYYTDFASLQPGQGAWRARVSDRRTLDASAGLFVPEARHALAVSIKLAALCPATALHFNLKIRIKIRDPVLVAIKKAR